MMLTKINYQDFRTNIPYDDLNKLFQDAIQASGPLGINYIWIDCLCIIQDSREDWLNESARMGAVYRNSYLNIAGTGFKDGNAGLFVQRDPDRLSTTILIETSRASEKTVGGFFNSSLWEEDVANAPLNRRGWVIQERCLAVRTLHFGSEQLFWECAENSACELWPKKLPSVMPLKNFKGLTLGRGAVNNSDRDTSGHAQSTCEDACERWLDIVQEYSKCHLTYSSDKLIAISALARSFQSSIGSPYLSGMWEYKLINQLLWSVRLASPLPRPSSSELRGPSWSWSAVDGPVEFPISQNKVDGYEYNYSFFSEVVDARTVPVEGSDAFNQISSGTLTLSGPLGMLKLLPDDGEIIFDIRTDLDDDGGPMMLVSIEWDTREAAGVVNQKASFGMDSEKEVLSSYLIRPVSEYNGSFEPLPNTPNTNPSTGLFFMPIAEFEEPEWISSGYRFVHCLALVPTEQKPGQYKRLGIFNTRWTKKEPDQPQTRLCNEMKKGCWAGLSPDYYVRLDNSKYVIEVV